MAEKHTTGTQKPADANAPRPGGASYNSEGGFSDPRNAPVQTPRANMTENRDTDRPQADKTDPDTVHSMQGMTVGTPVLDADGNLLPGGGMIGGGAIAEELPSPPPEPVAGGPNAEWIQHAARSRFAREFGAAMGRPITDWGLVGKGYTNRGLFIGVDVDSLEKVVIHDQHRLEDDRVLVNVRNIPEFLTQGDVLQKLSHGH